LECAGKWVKAAVAAVVELGRRAPAKVKAAAEAVQDPALHDRLRQDWLLIRDLLQGKVKERFGPLVQKLAGKAYFENNPEVSHVTYEAEPIAAE